MLTVTSISIQDTFGVHSVKFTPGTVTVIKGPNGAGKSSIARAFVRVFEGGHDPTIIRRGAEKSVVIFTLSDGTVVTRTCEPKKRRKGDEQGPVQFKTTVEIVDADGTPKKREAEYLRELGEPVAIDPGKLLALDVTTAPGLNAFAAEIQKVMPLSWSPEEIEQALELPPLEVRTIDGGPVQDNRTRTKIDVPMPRVERDLDLKGIRRYIADVTDARRRVGHIRDESDGAISSLQRSLPPDDGVDVAAELAAAELQRDTLKNRQAARRLDMERGKNDAMTEARGALNMAHAEVDADIEARFRALELERASRKAEATTAFNTSRELIDKAVAEEAEAIELEVGQPLKEAIARVAGLKEQVEGSLRAKFTREQIENATEKLRLANRQYEAMTDFLSRLESSVRRKLADLPIPGLVVDDSGVSLGGIAWQNVNTAKRVEVVLQLCSLRSGKLGIFFLDDAEHLTNETRRALEEGIADAGFQLVEAIATDQDGLTIEIVRPLVAA